MEYYFSLIYDNLQYVIMVFLSLVSLCSSISGIVNKVKKNKSVKLSSLVQNLPDLVSTAEALFPNVGKKTGTEKRFSVLSYIKLFCSQNGIPFDEDFWSSQIEAVLSTPQKNIKEVSANETKKDNKTSRPQGL